MAVSPTRPPPIGVDDQGGPPLPWLAGPLRDALALRQAHALLVHGAAGTGQLELALTLAQTLLCERVPQAAEPVPACGQCASCHLVRQRAHPDLLVLLPEALRVQYGWLDDDEGKLARGEAKPSRELKVAQVREAIAWGQQTSGRGRGKVLVLHPADALNAAAANALLKTLEEPPGALRLLLTTADPERLLPTVRSRCQRVHLPTPPADQATVWLRSQGLAAPDSLLALASGSPLEALAWAAEGVGADWLAQLPGRVAAGDAAVLLGKPLPRVIDLLLKLAHDAAVQAVGGAPRFYPAGSVPPGARPEALAVWQRALLRAARHDEHPWNAGLLVESLVGQAAGLWPMAPARGAGRPGRRPGLG